MAVHLARLYIRLTIQLQRAEKGFENGLMLTAHADRHMRRYVLDGVISDAWQAYCDFVREVCIASSIGAISASGAHLAPSIFPITPERASYIAVRTARGHPIIAGSENSEKWKEPTWGDPAKIDTIIMQLNPVNLATLRSAFLSSLLGPRHCQTVRNACAHRNDQTLKNVTDLSTKYVAHQIWVPSEASTWQVPGTRERAFKSWTDDMRNIAEAAVK
jgi:hypothetical protein